MIAPYGTWSSPISAAMVAAQGLRLGAVSLDGDDIYWLEGRPSESGRIVLVRRTPDGRIRDVTPPPFNVRTRVHEYGGGAYVVDAGVAWFSNFSDQCLYRVDCRSDDGVPRAVTPEGPWRFADGCVDGRRGRLICVREDHGVAFEPVNALVSIAFDGSTGAGTVLAHGYDFYSTPRLSADGRRLAWLCWRHPNMPWDGTELWVADVGDDGALTNVVRVAGGDRESIYQPGWLADGSLVFATDRTGWWDLHRTFPEGSRSGAGLPPSPKAAARLAEARFASEGGYGPPVTAIVKHPIARTEFGRPQWVFGTATWTQVDAGRLLVSYTRDGRWSLATIDLANGECRDVPTELEPLEWLAATATHAVVVAASPTEPEAVVRIGLISGAREVIRSSMVSQAARKGPPRRDQQSTTGSLSRPQGIRFPTAGGAEAYAFFYPPANDRFEGPPAEQPPLIVISHGGPTTATRDALDLKVQFWTSRGFAVADVNYRGSSGYGRAYREALNGQWGIADVDDMIAAARYLVGEGKADPARLIIRGGSAGGYTTLAALTFHPGIFRAGASYYGICDLEVLARDTHKFESRYLDSMVGPYPERQDLYRARSPIHFVDRLSCALILFQGLEDKVVPPNQSQMMADAVRTKGLPVAYVTFAGEQHGFRKADTIVRSLEAELYFYGAVFGFAIADPIEAVAIDNL
ncbi:MAG TPA: prolyl oligopeptidase family serine peptidase [Vicinamibacterales bacterium]|nr:prolyl oligopeptidase family serine peptidase [Vicinamibacterales bacterium]